MAQVNFKMISMVVLVIGIAIILATIGVFGWVVGGKPSDRMAMKGALKLCREHAGRGTRPNVPIRFTEGQVDCKRLRGLIAVYVLLIVTLVMANEIGWMIVTRRWNSFRLKICFIVFSFIAACLSICLLALYTSKETYEPIQPNANLGIGIVTLLFNLAMIAHGALFILWHSKMDMTDSAGRGGFTTSGGSPTAPSPTPTPSGEADSPPPPPPPAEPSPPVPGN